MMSNLWPKMTSALVSCALLMLIPAVAGAADKKPAGQIVASDQDKNGKPDHWQTYDSDGRSILVASDTNQDGKPDYWKHPVRGLVILRERDRNFDGKVDDRQLTDFIYDSTLKFNRHLPLWHELDGNFDGTIDMYRVRGQKKPLPDRTGQPIDPAPWSEAKEISKTSDRRLSQAEKTITREQVRQMNARHELSGR